MRQQQLLWHLKIRVSALADNVLTLRTEDGHIFAGLMPGFFYLEGEAPSGLLHLREIGCELALCPVYRRASLSSSYFLPYCGFTYLSRNAVS